MEYQSDATIDRDQPRSTKLIGVSMPIFQAGFLKTVWAQRLINFMPKKKIEIITQKTMSANLRFVSLTLFCRDFFFFHSNDVRFVKETTCFRDQKWFIFGVK
jgi:hypothetical protein